MEVYIEIAFLENFLIDGMLLTLSLKAARRKTSVLRIILASALGAVFAIIFPLLSLGKTAALALKFPVGALLCFVAIGEKGAGRYALSVVFFYALSFALGGMLLAIFGAFSLPYEAAQSGYLIASAPVGGMIAGCFFFALFALWFIKRLHARRRIMRFIYPCRVVCGEREIAADGFLDSGNRAAVAEEETLFGALKSRPLNFISPELAFELLGEAAMTAETTVQTVSGRKKIKIFRADKLEIYCGAKPNIIENVYFAPTPHIRAREYKILLNVRCFDMAEETDGSAESRQKGKTGGEE
ncbi:MAG: sigma-E processing peptidase SpoIIGA [Clostridia bacterium]|nr:sigma-E processing peptidase SpoIIGA [Clostridia bacterium]